MEVSIRPIEVTDITDEFVSWYQNVDGHLDYGLPSLVVETAVNQAGAAAAMKKAGAALSIRPLTDPCFGELLALALQQLVKAQFIVSLPHASARLFDGDGALRGAKLLEGNV